MLALINDFYAIVYANAADDIVNALKAYIGPILLLLMGIVAMTFLFRRQISQFLIFIGIAIVVALIFYAPDFIVSISQNFKDETSL